MSPVRRQGRRLTTALGVVLLGSLAGTAGAGAVVPQTAIAGSTSK